MLISDLDYAKESLNKVNGGTANSSATAFASAFASGNFLAFQSNLTLAISGTGSVGFNFRFPAFRR